MELRTLIILVSGQVLVEVTVLGMHLSMHLGGLLMAHIRKRMLRIVLFCTMSWAIVHGVGYSMSEKLTLAHLM